MLPAACGDGASAPSSVVSRDTVDGVLVVTNDGPGAWADASTGPWTVGPATLRIGSIEGDGPDVFGAIAAVAVDGDRIYVADGVALEVRAFGLDGSFLLAFGASGEGPGEFGAIDGLAIEPDGSVAVRDPRLSRISRFARDGESLSTFRLERSFFVFSDGTTFWADRTGRLYDQIPLSLQIDEPSMIGLVTYTDGVARDTIEVLSYELTRVTATRDGRLVLSLLGPFVSNPRVAVGTGGTVAVAEGSAFRVEAIPPGGGIRMAFRRALEPDAVAASEEASAVAALRARVDELSPGATVDDVPVPGRKPAYARLFADSEGHWWAGRYRSETDPEDPTAAIPVAYDVYDADGLFMGTVSTPPIHIMAIGRDFLAGKETDDLGVEYAVLLSLDR